MPDGILTPCNVARSRHWFRQVTAPCNVAYGSGIVTVNSPSGITLHCDTWLWDDMPLNSTKRLSYWNSTSGFHSSPQSTCHSVPVCEILSKSDHPRQKKMTSCRFSRWRISAILDCRDLIMGSLNSQVKLTQLRHYSYKLLSFLRKLRICILASRPISAILDFRDPIIVSLKSSCTTSYRSSIETIALNCLVFFLLRKSWFLHFGDRQTNRQTDGQPQRTKPLSLSRTAA